MMTDAVAGCTLLLVDDEEANLDVLEGCLRAEGFERLVRTMDPREVPALLAAHRPDLVLLDLHMPHKSGFVVLREIRELTPPGDYLPVLVLTADATPEAKERALSGGARDFLTKPFDVVEVGLRVRNLLETRLLYRTRDRVLSIVAHDLRNPLASIAMNAEMLRELLPPRAGAHRRAALESIEKAASRMHRLVEDLLEVSRFEQGAPALCAEPVAPATIFDEAGRLLQPLATARRIQLTFHAAASAPAVRADCARIVQVLSNLVGNALKFTPEGGCVAVRARAVGAEVVVSVADTGPGIPPDELPHLFKAFWQGVPGDGRGVGLGLVIARTLVQAHGGRIWVESTAGEGSEFAFTLPAAG